MSQLTRTTWDSTYNNNSSGSFKTNSTQAITETVMQQFAKDGEDSLAFLTDVNQFLSKQNIGLTSAGVVPDASIMGIKSFFSTSDASIFHINGYFQANQEVATTNSIQALEGYAATEHPSGTVTLAIGTIGNVQMASTGTLSLARSMQAGGQTSAAGTVTEWDGLYVSIANSGGATIAKMIGVNIDVFPSGVTTKYGVVVAETTALNGFGIASPTAFVHAAASTTSAASMCLPHGTAPSSPNNGDFWTTTTGAFIRINGSTIALGGGISGLTTGKLPYATSSTTIADSELSRSGTGSYLIAGGSSTGKLSISSTGTSYIAQNLHTYSTPDMLEIGNTVSNAPINLAATGGVVMTNYPSATTNFPSDYGSYGLTINTDMTSNVTGYPLRLRGGSTVNTSAGFGNAISFESQVVATFVQGNSIVSSLTSTGSGGSFDLIFYGLGNGISGEKMRITSQGDIYGIAGSTSMADGFFYIPSGAGAPSSTPTTFSGRVPMYYDATNNNFYIYNAAWKKVALL